MNKKPFDERQLTIRGKVFSHGLIVALALVLFNAFLQGSKVVWANSFDQNLLIFMAIITFVSIESILRDVYFWQLKTPWPQIALFGIVSIVLTAFCLRDILRGATFIENSGLTETGSHLVFDTMFIATALIGVIKVLSERRSSDE
jgi:hypothetical protein